MAFFLQTERAQSAPEQPGFFFRLARDRHGSTVASGPWVYRQGQWLCLLNRPTIIFPAILQLDVANHDYIKLDTAQARQIWHWMLVANPGAGKTYQLTLNMFRDFLQLQYIGAEDCQWMENLHTSMAFSTATEHLKLWLESCLVQQDFDPERLRNKMLYLLDQLIPEAGRRIGRLHQFQPLEVVRVAEFVDQSFHWELLPWGDSFLGLVAPVIWKPSRLARGFTARMPRKLAIIAPRAGRSLPHLAAEAESVNRWSQESNLFHRIDFLTGDVRPDDITGAFARSDVVYYCGHGEYTREGPCLILKDGELPLAHIQSSARQPLLLLFSACLPMGGKRFKPLQLPAAMQVFPLGHIGDQPLGFCPSVWRKLLNGHNLGQAVWQTRAEFYQKKQIEWSFWRAWGNPDFSLMGQPRKFLPR